MLMFSRQNLVYLNAQLTNNHFIFFIFRPHMKDYRAALQKIRKYEKILHKHNIEYGTVF